MRELKEQGSHDCGGGGLRLVHGTMGLVQQCVVVGKEGVADTEVLPTDAGNRVPAVWFL